ALKDRNYVSRSFADELLKWRKGPKEEFERAGNPLLELHWVRPLWLLVSWPGDTPHFGHRREPVIQLSNISPSFSRITPGDIDAHSSIIRAVFSPHMVLVVSPSNLRLAHVLSFSKVGGLGSTKVR